MAVKIKPSKVNRLKSTSPKTHIGFLQFLYSGTVDVNLSETARLLLLARQCQQEDLYHKCVNILVRNMTPGNSCWMFDFACERDIDLLKDWCIKFFQENMSFDNIMKWSKYWQSQKYPQDETENRQVIEKCVDFLLKDLFKLMSGDKESLKLFESFLVQSVSMQNIVKLSECFPHYQLKMTNLTDALFHFVDVNFHSLQEQGLFKKLHFYFELAYSGYKKRQTESSISTQDCSIAIESESTIQVNHRHRDDKAQRKAIKRMDPSSHSSEEEERWIGPTLKKNKEPSRS